MVPPGWLEPRRLGRVRRSRPVAGLSFAAAMHDLGPRRSILLAVMSSVALIIAACGTAVPTSSPLPVLPTAGPPTTGEVATVPPTMVVEESEAPEASDPDPGSPGTPPCPTDELKASRGSTQVEGDERITEVILVSAGTCSIDAYPTLLLEDGSNRIVVAASAGGPGGIDLVPGVAYTSDVRISNWCLGDPDYPMRIGILHGIETLLVTGDSFPDEGDLPACVHEDADPALSGTAWQPAP